jgi:hypothetical protein
MRMVTAHVTFRPVGRLLGVLLTANAHFNSSAAAMFDGLDKLDYRPAVLNAYRVALFGPPYELTLVIANSNANIGGDDG